MNMKWRNELELYVFGLRKDDINTYNIIHVYGSAKRAPANVRQLNNISDVIFFCSVGER